MRRFAIPVVASVFISTTWVVGQEGNVKITDRNLSSVNYAVDSLEYWIGKLNRGDTRRAATLLRDHQKLVTRFNRLPVSNSREYMTVAKRIADAKHAIQARAGDSQITTSTDAKTIVKTSAAQKVSRLTSRVHSLESDLEHYGTKIPRQTSRMRSDIETIQSALSRLEKSSHPDYISLVARVKSLRSKLSPAANSQSMTIDQANAYVESIRRKYSQDVTLPQARDMMNSGELTSKDVDDFMKQLREFREQRELDLPKLKQVVESSGVGRYWLEWVDSKALSLFSRELDSLSRSIESQISSSFSIAKQRSSLDVEKHSSVFHNVDQNRKDLERFRRAQRTLQEASRLEELLQLPNRWSSKQRELASYIAAFESKVRLASAQRVLPVNVGTPEQHDIGSSVLGIEKYGVGKVVRQIVTSKIIPRERIEHKPFNGQIETIVRKWQEFQVATVEQEGEQYFVYHNRIAKFSRAPRTTPTGVWILSQRLKSGEISRDRL